jgi:hypothetical protein
MEDTSAAIYSEAKSEYTKQLVFNFQPVLLRFFLDRYTEAKTAVAVVSKTKSALSEFQDSLSQIPEWNLDKVQRETGALIQAIHCDYIEDLITAVFIAHTKILSAIRLHAKPRRKINITVPKPEHFMHRTMSECSRILWSSVYLFSDTVSSLDRQKNMSDVNRSLEEGILQAIRNLLPVKSILRDSLQEDDDDVIHISAPTPEASESAEPQAEAVAQPLAEAVEAESVAEPVAEALAEPLAEALAVKEPEAVAEKSSLVNVSKVDTPKSEEAVTEVGPTINLDSDQVLKSNTQFNTSTLVVDTEKSVGFTGMDSVFGDGGHAELRPTIEEGSDEFKILGESEDLDLNEFEDLDSVAPLPLAADDYESL